MPNSKAYTRVSRRFTGTNRLSCSLCTYVATCDRAMRLHLRLSHNEDMTRESVENGPKVCRCCGGTVSKCTCVR